MLKAICVILFAIHLSKISCTFQNSTLELVHVIFRHGDRTPARDVLYPKDPYKNFTYEPVGDGQLTNVGKQRLFNLGLALRKRYTDFLGVYTSETLYARSTDYDRTKMSLQLVLASLFPPENEFVWTKNLMWQPFSFHYEPYQKDHILGQTYRNCPKYRHLYWNYLQSEEAQEKYKNFSDALNYIENHTGLNATSKSLFELYLSLQMEEEYGLKLPEWTQHVYPNILKKIAFLENHSRSATSELKKLSGGYLLKKIIQDTNKKIKNLISKNRKIYLYSGHEFNISYLMQFLGIYFNHIPPYAAYILIEIHNSEDNHNIKVFYQDYQAENPRELEITNCSNICSFKAFVKLFKKLLPKNNKECEILNK